MYILIYSNNNACELCGKYGVFFVDNLMKFCGLIWVFIVENYLF